MDSSDSEDDCYGNIAKKLQSMKNKFTEDKIDSTNLLNESLKIDEIVNKAEPKPANVTKANETQKETDTDYLHDKSIDELIATSSRVTRSAAKRNSSILVLENLETEKTPIRKKSKKQSSKSDKCSTREKEVSVVTNSRTTRGRGRNRRRNLDRSRNDNSDFSDIPTFSVGNTHEYPDQSDNQQLFSNKPSKVFTIDDDDEMDDNEDMSVKVYWQSSEIVIFTIRRHQKISKLFDHFSKKENVDNDKLLFTYNDKILKPNDTPDSINYSIVKFIDGGIVSQSITKLIDSNDIKNITNGIKLKFQCQDIKKPYEIIVGADEKLSMAMLKCAEHLEITLDKLKFEFDGDLISGKDTARELNLEGGECIDVKMIR